MKLLKLSSSNAKFKSIEFEDGLNIVAGIQLSKEQKKTYNGVGKSFSLKLIHLLLGGSLKKKTEKEKKTYDFLSGYGDFYLDFSHKGETYSVTKNFSNNYYTVNDEKYSNTKYISFLRETLLNNSVPSEISLKQVINSFARRYGDKYYNDAHTQQGVMENDYYQRLVNLYLLKMETSLVNRKCQVKTAISKLEKTKVALKDIKKQSSSSNLKDLKDTLSVLIKKKKAFSIAEQYDDLKSEADTLTEEINVIRSNIFSLRSDITVKNKSLSQINNIDIDIKGLERIYEEAKFFFPDQVKKQLSDASCFHSELMKNRVKRIESDIAKFNKSMRHEREHLVVLEKKRDSLLKDLDSSGAFEEYDSIVERMRSVTRDIEELESYAKVLKDVQEEEISLGLENAEIQSLALEYLNNKATELEEIENNFRYLVKRFYDNYGGNLSVGLSKDAKYLYDLDIHVPRDNSQGVNEVKIFCYDFLLYSMNRELLGFLAHDGCIFSELDPRQKAMMFKLAMEYVLKYDFQYFVNIGQSSLREILASDILDPIEKEQIKSSVRLELYDDKPESWLFGETFG